MNNRLKPYPEYKESGLSWLGQIPAHWQVKRIKHIAKINPSRSEALPLLQTNFDVTFLPMERVGTDGRIDPSDQRPITSVWSGFTYFRRNDVILAKITPCFENGKGACLTALPTEIGFGSTEFIVLRARGGVSPQFLHLIMTLPDFRSLGANAMIGAAGQQRVPSDFVANFVACFPPPDEQGAIVRYLDYADRRIRRYIAAKRKLIALLNEQKQAIVHNAVTRGLDPNVRLKPSGVAWLGDIPEHWEVSRSKHLFSVRKEAALPDDVQLSATQAYGVIPQEEFEQRVGRRVVKILLHLEKRKHVEQDDFVMSMRSFQGGLERAWAKGAIRSSYVILKPGPNVDVQFFSYVFKSYGYIRALQGTANFIRDGQDLTEANFREVDLPLIPLPEQRAIADYIATTTANINREAARLEREIDLIREYRTRLIADVVTGKLDVRAAAANLPDEIAVDEPLEEALADEDAEMFADEDAVEETVE